MKRYETGTITKLRAKGITPAKFNVCLKCGRIVSDKLRVCPMCHGKVGRKKE